MDMEARKTLTNEEVIRELLDLLKKNAMKEQANDGSIGWANVSLYDQVRGHGRRNASNPVYLSVHSKVFGQRCHDWLYQGIRQHST